MLIRAKNTAKKQRSLNVYHAPKKGPTMTIIAVAKVMKAMKQNGGVIAEWLDKHRMLVLETTQGTHSIANETIIGMR